MTYTATLTKDLETGMYRNAAGTIYKVYKGQSGRMLSKILTAPGEGWTGPHFEYAGLAVRFVKADQRMTLEQAKAYGILTGICCCCGKDLTVPKSVAAGIGPVCAKRF